MRNVVISFALLGLSGAAFAASTATSAKSGTAKVSVASNAPSISTSSAGSSLSSTSATSASTASAATSAPASASKPLSPAAAALSTSITQIPEAPGKFSGTFSVGRSNSLYIENGNSKSASWDFSGALGYALTPTLKTTALVEGSQDIKDETASDFAKETLELSYHKQKPVAPVVDFTPAMKWAFPASRASRSESLKGSLSTSLRADLNPDYLFSKKLSMYFKVSGARNFHDYSTAVSGKVNNQYSSTQAVNVGWNFTDALSLTVLYTHINYWTYQGAMTEFFNHTEELGYELTKNWSLTLGHSYGNPIVSVRQADQATINTNLSDEENSIVYGQIGYTF